MKLRLFAERLYSIVDESDDFYSAVEGIEDALKKLMPINIKKGITNTAVEVTNEGVVVKPNTDTLSEPLFYVKEETDDRYLNKSVRNRQ